MYRNCQGGVSRAFYLTQDTVPEYSIPSDLEQVLNINDKSAMSSKSKMYSKILESLSATKYVDLSESHYVQLLKLGLFLEEYASNEEMKKRKLFKQTIRRVYSCHREEVVFKIPVKDLDEERPWIRENDFVDVIDTRTYRSFTLKVTNVTKTDIIASDSARRLCKVFKPRHLYNINFRFQNYPLRCSHWALWIAYKESVITYLFPHKSKSFVNMEIGIHGTLTMFNPNIQTNPEQKQAVLNIVNKSSFPAPYILYGPPGTGKTATLIEAIIQIHKASPLNLILVCTPSNTAADEVARRLLKYVDDLSYLYRIYSQSREKSTIDEELRNCSFYGGKKKVPLRREDIVGKKILISTLCTAMKFSLMKLKADYFSHIIIDEAGQGTEADILIPISVASKDGKLHSQIVLAGDPQQLGPTVISKLADIILGRSILERLMSYDIYQKDCHNNYNPKYITKLLHNYRSHPSIIHISNKLFYDNELIAKASIDDETKTFPVIFHGVEGIEEKCSYSTSTFNNKEIGLVLKYVDDLMDNKTEFGEVSSEDIGIVTLFTLQSKKIKKILKAKDNKEQHKLQKNSKDVAILKKDDPDVATITNETKDDERDQENKNEDVTAKNDQNVSENENENDVDVGTDDAKIKLRSQHEKAIEATSESDNDKNLIKCRNYKDINVGTVELFQGQERKIMIMTAVRSKTFFHDGKEHIGFLSHPKRFNVAMSRARDGLIVVGNPGILQKDEMWQYLLKYCIDNQSYRGFKFDLRDSCSEEPDVSQSQSIPTTDSLFKEKPFKLFYLDSGDSATLDILKTVREFVKSEEDEDEDDKLRLVNAFKHDFQL